MMTIVHFYSGVSLNGFQFYVAKVINYHDFLQIFVILIDTILFDFKFVTFLIVSIE